MKKILAVVVILLSIFTLTGCDMFNKTTDEEPEVNISNDTFDPYKLFKSGMLAVEKNDKWGYVDKDNTVIIDFLFDAASAFYNDKAVVQVNDEYYIIDTTGQNILDTKYDDISRDLETGYFFYKLNEKWGVMDQDGTILTDALYNSINSYSYGLARVNVNSKYGFIDKDGDIAISIQYDYAMSFENGFAVVENNGKYGFINTEGTIVVDYLYDNAYNFDENNRARVFMYEPDVAYLINTRGETILTGDDIDSTGTIYGVTTDDVVRLFTVDGPFNTIDYQYFWYGEGYQVNLELDDLHDTNYWFNEDGTVFAEALYNDSYFGSSLDETELYLLEEDGAYNNLYTKDHTYRLEFEDFVQYIPGGHFIVVRNDKCGLIDGSDNTIIEFLYDELFLTNDNYYIYQVNGLYGIMNSSYETLFNAQYDDFYTYFNI